MLRWKEVKMSQDTSIITWISSKVEQSIQVKQHLLESEALLDQISRVAERIAAALNHDHRIYLFGNGGSAADAQHLAAELVGRFYQERRALSAEALTVNSSILTAIGNDYDFSQLFSRQLEANGRAGDVAIGLSTSGTSKNVVQGIRRARQLGLYTVALTGQDGGLLRDVAEECICVPSTDTPRIQESHILIGHILCELVENTLFPSYVGESVNIVT
jgi:D-sedoheptulose 7-phosphate isomerase